MATRLGLHTASAGWRRIVLIDFEDDLLELTAALQRALLALADPVDWPDGTLTQVDLLGDDAQTLEVVSAGAHGLALIRLLIQRVPAVDVRRRNGAAVAPMRLVEVPANCIDALAAAVDVLTAAVDTGHPGIVAAGLRAAADHLRTAPAAIVELAVRALRLWDVPWTNDHEAVADALARAGDGTPVVLSPHEDLAYRRLRARLHAAWDLDEEPAPAPSGSSVDTAEGRRRIEE